MAKNMAKIRNNIVINTVWCCDNERETDTLKDPGDRFVGIGDTYRDGKWYHDGVEILTALEKAYAKIEAMQAELRRIGYDDSSNKL